MNRLWVRLSLSFVIITWVVIGVVAILVRYSVQENFGSFLNITNSVRFGSTLVEELISYYEETGSWEDVNDIFPTRIQAGNRQGQGSQIYITDAEQIIVASTNPGWISQTLDSIGPNRTVKLIASGEIIGYVGEQTPGTIALNTAEQQFLTDTTIVLLLTAVGGGIFALIVGLFLARSLTYPLQEFTTQVDQMTTRDLGRPVTTRGTIEITQLSTAFNTLSERLAMESKQRQRMTADVAHELRTPVSIMRGHLEAMMDGIYPMDVPHLAIAYDQVIHLARLVEDLRLLTKAEAKQLPLDKVHISPNILLDNALKRFKPLADDAHVNIRAELAAELPIIEVDQGRIQQVLDNLLTNALRHTPEGGMINLSSRLNNSTFIEVCIHNNGKPISKADAEHIFDRFWRAQEARERDEGGTGLGLAITKSLITLHGGDIHATPTADGTTFYFTLPIVADSNKLRV